ncbi:GerAB/ArcD/ProY family transporter [Tenuibacillus multivorans]|uniref:Spore germination protein (Amino acid permease) n=1 Tax=Tenuibacillus multivorans TaxID=237069 RepID=A0A1H0EVB7_9BACI|nr:GerAB/ArcD/ProY family transporter [Tenuibacillus multivorans]GEL76940.1 germination protein GerB [Tenuibacillus multivorans]SDN86331.1 spore germination protein (amino acid permease) [Tenuibacillus multivorans]
MKNQLSISEDKKFKAAYLILALHTLQIGVGIAGFPRLVYMEAKHDAWISILIAGVILHLTVACIVFVLRSYETDLHGILNMAFGKVIGKFFSTLFVLYFAVMFFSVLVNYIEFVQVFIFPKMSSFFVAILILMLVWYAVYGGIRVAIGVSFLFFFSSVWMVLLLSKPLTMIEPMNYLPIFESDMKEIFSGVLISSYSLLGFELLWVVFPFIYDKKKVGLHSQISMGFTIFMVLGLTLISIGYFSPRQLEEKVWPLLSMFKIISIPAFERFDILAVALWLLVILPNAILLGWMVSYSCKRAHGLKQKHCLVVLIIIALLLASIFDDRQFVNRFTDFTGYLGMFFGFGFPFLLLPFAIIHRMKGKKQNDKK